MSSAMRRWAAEHGFTYTRADGWTRPDGCFLRDTMGGWRVFTPGCGYHPTEQPPRAAQ